MVFGIGDKLFKIKITVEPPSEPLEEEELLDDEEEQEERAEVGPGKGDNNSTGKNEGDNLSAPSSTKSSTSGTNTKSTQSKQAAISFLNQLQDPLTLEQGMNLFKEMELAEDDEEEDGNSSYTNSETGEIATDDVEDVVYSPVLSNTPVAHLSPTIMDAKELVREAWGPVIATRKSSRVDIGDTKMLQIAMEKQKVRNLEAGKNSLKDDYQAMDDPLYWGSSGEAEKNLPSADPTHASPLQAGGGWINPGNDTRRGSAELLGRSLLDKLSLSKNAGRFEPSPPPRIGWNLKQKVASPTTPLELAVSPPQSPPKKKKLAKTSLKELELCLGHAGLSG